MTSEEAVVLFRSTKQEARDQVTDALRTGRLTKARYCSQCGSRKNLQAHHEDYEAAFVVEWLCQHCHVLRHRLRHFKTADDVLNGACHCGCTFCFVGLPETLSVPAGPQEEGREAQAGKRAERRR